MVAENREFIDRAWWATLFPCLMLFLTVLALNLIGDRSRPPLRHPGGGDLSEGRTQASGRPESGLLLEVEDLRTYFRTPRGKVKAVDGVSFTLDRGKALGIVGESGLRQDRAVPLDHGTARRQERRAHRVDPLRRSGDDPSHSPSRCATSGDKRCR